ncbi:hypothetical protein MRS44_000215 [Fusarium solani]|uniref:uncharacterized protein n=1 Tax=Fusarium solani TaxID=169388 RepID=UPI0032C4812E|nr:hypothetical protein MRS44_000215 [Fusarium solani]
MGIDKEVFFYNIAGAFESVFRAEALPAVAKEGPAEDFRCWARRHIRPLAERTLLLQVASTGGTTLDEATALTLRLFLSVRMAPMWARGPTIRMMRTPEIHPDRIIQASVHASLPPDSPISFGPSRVEKHNIANSHIALLQTRGRYIDPAPPLDGRGKKAFQTEGDEVLDGRKEQPSKPCWKCHLQHIGGESAKDAQDARYDDR